MQPFNKQPFAKLPVEINQQIFREFGSRDAGSLRSTCDELNNNSQLYERQLAAKQEEIQSDALEKIGLEPALRYNLIEFHQELINLFDGGDQEEFKNAMEQIADLKKCLSELDTSASGDEIKKQSATFIKVKIHMVANEYMLRSKLDSDGNISIQEWEYFNFVRTKENQDTHADAAALFASNPTVIKKQLEDYRQTRDARICSRQKGEHELFMLDVRSQRPANNSSSGCTIS